MRPHVVVGLLLLALLPLGQAGPSAPRTDEYLGTSILAWPAAVWLDPGAPAAERNPQVILPGTTEVKARATVVNDRGEGVGNVAVSGQLEHESGIVELRFEKLSAGVFDSEAETYRGGRVTLRVAYDFGRDGTVDHVGVKTYRPIP